MGISAGLTAHVSATIRDRGRDYFRSGAVGLQSVRPNSASAWVAGSDDYFVDLAVDGQTVRAECTCPYVDQYDAACKHIWATILAAEERGFAAHVAGPARLVIEAVDDADDWEDEYNPTPPRNRGHFPSPPPAPPPPKWSDQLATLRRELDPTASRHAPPVERELLYVVDQPASEQARKLVLEVQFRERKKNGEWGKPKAQSISAHNIDSLAAPADRQLLALLSGAEKGDGYGHWSGFSGYGVNRYKLTGPLLDAVLPTLADTERVFLRRDSRTPTVFAPAVPDLDPPWQLVVGVAPDESRKNWVLNGHLRRGEDTVPLTAPDLIVPGLVFRDGKFARLHDGGAFAWVPALRRVGGLTVPRAKADELVGQLLRMPKLPGLALPDELRVTEECVPPRPRLEITKPKTNYGPPVLHAELSFEYDTEIIPVTSPDRGVYRPDGRRFLARDFAAERAAALELDRLGVRPPTYSYGPKNLRELKPSQLPGLVTALVPAGWRVEADGSLYRKSGFLELAVKSGQDWFDLEGAADFDGLSVPFPQLLAALARGDSTVILGDGTIGLIPDDWLKKYGLIGTVGRVEGDAVRFSKTQLGVLDALLAARPEIGFDKRFGKARDELRKFAGIAAVSAPPGFKGDLREYQKEGLGWLRFLRKFGFGGCLADDMGLGKTVQVLALLADKRVGKRPGPALVVVPRSLVFNWKNEAAKFAPKLTVIDHTGPTRDRTGANFAGADIVLTTYGTLRNDATLFAEQQFDTCVLDESQAAKNASTETAKAVRVVRADHRLALSGTPVENHLGELWTLFDFLNPGMLGHSSAASVGAGVVRNPDADTRTFLARALKPFILRRTKDQVAKDLPQKTEQTVYCDLGPAQRKTYDELRAHYRASLLARVDSVGLKRSQFQVLEALLRLRQAACHPGLIDKKRVNDDSAKLDVLLPDLRELSEGGSKVLVFSQFTSLLSIVKGKLDAEKITYEYLDGKTRDRQAKVDRFQTDPACKLFLISLKAGGVGLNLTAAGYVFLLDPWWNPAVEAQAIDRSHRIGQDKPVFAYRLIARNTVEEKVLALQASKKELADAILGGDGRVLADLKREDLELLLS